MATASRPLRVAVEGCGHGELHAIYTSIQKSCRAKGWDGVDLLIIGGDFQACRNNHDMTWMAVPPKYRDIRDFHEYYSGNRVAPYLTIFIGGNHEASNHLQELYYGGWVAPNIYYMGAANVVNVGGIRIAGLSGIWKGYDYAKPHYHISSLTPSDDVRQLYHQREIDVRKLLQLRSQVDVGLSHDWPRSVEHAGNLGFLLKKKQHFTDDVKSGKLGSIAARYVLDHLRPYHWFSAHLHVKYAAVVRHEKDRADDTTQEGSTAHNPDELDVDDQAIPHNPDELDVDDSGPSRNPDELDIDDQVEAHNPDEVDVNDQGPSRNPDELEIDDQATSRNPDEIDVEDIVPTSNGNAHPPSGPPNSSVGAGITNNLTKFLALDKCLPRKNFLQLLEIPRHKPQPTSPQDHIAFQYDPEWLAITRVFAQDAKHVDARLAGNNASPKDRGRAFYEPLIDEELKWVEEKVASKGKLTIPSNFQRVAPVYDRNSRPKHHNDRPANQANPQMDDFCNLLEIPNPLE